MIMKNEKRNLTEEIENLTAENLVLKVRLDIKDRQDQIQQEDIKKVKNYQEGWWHMQNENK